jgi:hypothetical protein
MVEIDQINQYIFIAQTPTRPAVTTRPNSYAVLQLASHLDGLVLAYKLETDVLRDVPVGITPTSRHVAQFAGVHETRMGASKCEIHPL